MTRETSFLSEPETERASGGGRCRPGRLTARLVRSRQGATALRALL